ncbi:asparagine synthase-domain-containing protein [Collybia nuda]|uniref:Asparagine synthase-domain-containing protein n=1 Tax=Collybia nuda TaxID=64659 RepID=A0A9P5XUK3_9AGAR|nr:asparagine synthase-domain-containing protein [Collybia nuda]
MCGIFVSVCHKPSAALDGFADKLRAANARRDVTNLGPDANSIYRTSADYLSSTLFLEFFASELRLRGLAPVVQPHQQDGDVLCWNGEIFDGISVAPENNDGVELFRKLRTLGTPGEISSRCLFFGRDPLGRRSLLIHRYTSSLPYFLLTSVSAGLNSCYEFEEINTDYIYCMDFSISNNCKPDFVFTTTHREYLISILYPSIAKPSRINPALPPEEFQQVESLDKIPEYLADAVAGLKSQLDQSVMLRVHDIPQTPKARVAVLFSGGIDSTVLAYFAHKHIPFDEPIDLLNVAFENPRKMKFQAEGVPKMKRRGKEQRAEKELTQTSYMVPDRITGLQALEELRRLCPERVWNFVSFRAQYEIGLESQTSRPTIESLMLPGRTVMDMSLALALYFASRGVGQMHSLPDSDPVPYASTARVLLSGLGSDELLGGYGRHRSAFNIGGWQAVINELQLEIDRIPTRNLGRDDRVISTHGKETRHPFLSLTVVEFLATLPVHFKMDPRLDVGLGDKMLLRLVASKVGLVEAGARKKRAMQFGSHSARMDGEKHGDTLLE